MPSQGMYPVTITSTSDWCVVELVSSGIYQFNYAIPFKLTAGDVVKHVSVELNRINLHKLNRQNEAIVTLEVNMVLDLSVPGEFVITKGADGVVTLSAFGKEITVPVGQESQNWQCPSPK